MQLQLLEAIEKRKQNELWCKQKEENQMVQDLKGKRILLIALPGYRDGIITKMRELGAETDLIHDKPNDGFICKTLGRYQVGFFQEVLNHYYRKALEPLKSRDYDYILSIRGEYTPISTLKLLKNYFPNSKLILYIWDGLHKRNTKGIEKKWPYYDKVYTFDRIDYEEYKKELLFQPLYYYEDYLPKELSVSNKESFIYDLSFIGTGHDDRIPIVKNVMEQCRKNGLRCFSYFYVPHQMVFLRDKICNQYYKNVKLSDVRFEKISFSQLYQIYANSKCVIDVENAGQHGLTMRSIEILGLKRKLITTNKDIKNYDFYNSSNVFILDRKNPVMDMEFFNVPYQMLEDDMYKKYSLENWIFEVLK